MRKCFFSKSCYNGDLWVYYEYAHMNSLIKVSLESMRDDVYIML